MAQVPEQEPKRYNFWGYSTLGFQAPMARYGKSDAALELK